MVFLSHTESDKKIVETLALKLSEIYGREQVFYDRWSIQPGDGIIDKMGKGLQESDILFLFVSSASLNSKMVSLEWQNSLVLASQGKMKIVPVRIDDCSMPILLLQTLYIDMYSLGMEDTLRQMIDVIEGRNTFRESGESFNNVYVVINFKTSNILDIEFHAKYVTEPVARFGIIFDSNNSHIQCECLSEGVYIGGGTCSIEYEKGKEGIIKFYAPSRALQPGFPFRLRFSDYSVNITLIDVVQEKAEGKFHSIHDRFDHEIRFKL